MTGVDTLDTLVADLIAAKSVTPAARDFFWWRLIDTLAASLGETANATTLRLRSGDSGAPQTEGTATVWTTGHSADPETAAFNNAFWTHRYEFDDTVREAAMHASTVVLPALVAVAETRNSSVADLLDSFAIASEVLVRLSWGTGPLLNGRGFHATGVLGAYGVVAGVSRLMSLDRETTVRGLSLLCSLTSGVGQYRSGGGDTKALHAAWASKVGLEATAMALQGLTGPRDSLEGRHGLFATHLEGEPTSHGVRQRFEPAVDPEWYAYRTQSKRFPVCHFLQSVIECAISVRESVDDPGKIARVDVFVPEDAIRTVAEPRTERLHPDTCIPQLSAYLVTAAALVDGMIGAGSFGDAPLRRDEVLRLAAITHCNPLPLSERLDDYPGGVRVELGGGMVVEKHVSQPTPMDAEDIGAKFRDACRAASRPSSPLDQDDDSVTVRELISGWLDLNPRIEPEKRA